MSVLGNVFGQSDDQSLIATHSPVLERSNRNGSIVGDPRSQGSAHLPGYSTIPSDPTVGFPQISTHAQETSPWPRTKPISNSPRLYSKQRIRPAYGGGDKQLRFDNSNSISRLGGFNMTLELSTSGRKHVLKCHVRRKQKKGSSAGLEERHIGRKVLYLDKPCCDLGKGNPRFPKRVQDYCECGAEGPDHPHNHPSYNTEKKNVASQF